MDGKEISDPKSVGKSSVALDKNALILVAFMEIAVTLLLGRYIQG